jgi:outer membrane protein assembly factor BamD
MPNSLGRRLTLCMLVAAFALGSGCASTGRRTAPPGTSQPDKFLFDKGTEALNNKRWVTAREYFKQVTETYTQSPLRPDSKLGIGDSYLAERSGESLVLAISEYQEFLSFYPTHPRADYAQYKIGMAHFRQMRTPQRDQTETRNTIREFDTFIARYPNSSLMDEVRSKLREARDRLGTSELEVGRFYYRIRWYPGAIDRLGALLKQDPEFSTRDAVYFYLGESLVKAKREAEAILYYEKILSEFEQSEYLEDARKRIAELKSAPVKASAEKSSS